MAGSAARVVITERQQEVLLRLSTAGTVARRLGQRARVILLAFAGLDNEAIAQRVGLERHQVGTWRRRWQRAFDKLVRIECLEYAIRYIAPICASLLLPISFRTRSARKRA